MGKTVRLTGMWCKVFPGLLELGNMPGDQGGTVPGVNAHASSKKVRFSEQK